MHYLPTPLDVELTNDIKLQITGLAGLEPTTYGLGNRRSIRLSYSPPGMNFDFKALWTVKAGEVIAIGYLIC